MTRNWAQIWDERAVERNERATLTDLMAADGFDTGFGQMSEQQWLAGINGCLETLGISLADTIFDVGCGAGAFLYPLHRRGFEVAGLDRSANLVELARAVMPECEFTVSDACDLPGEVRADVMLSFGVFLYFPSVQYASTVIERMCAGARRCVALLDLPDRSLRDQARKRRIEVVGGEERYAERYSGLEHLYFDRGWVCEQLEVSGLKGVDSADQWIPGYENGKYRFNAWGFLPDRS